MYYTPLLKVPKKIPQPSMKKTFDVFLRVENSLLDSLGSKCGGVSVETKFLRYLILTLPKQAGRFQTTPCI